MNLTRIYLNPKRRGAAKLLGSPQAMHAAVLGGFAPDQPLRCDRGRVLWRVDGAGTPHVALYVVSPEPPDFTGLCEQAGWPRRPNWQTRPYGEVLDGLAAGEQRRFRLTANPTHRVRLASESRPKIMGHVTVAQQEGWLIERAEVNGFRILATSEGEPGVAVHSRSVRSFRRDASRVTIAVATFDGGLEIIEPELLRRALVNGIGRARSYGCGLMTLVRS